MAEISNSPSVLITGANGFIGSRLCALFLREGFRVIAGVRKSADLSLLADIPVEYRYGDVTQPDALPAMVAGIDYVIHNAGIVKAKTKERFFEVNAEGTRNLLRAVESHNPGVKRLVLVSSLAAVGPSRDGSIITEQTEPHPVTVYGQSKLAGEKMCSEFLRKFPITIVRPHGVYGPGDKEALSFFQIANKRLRPLFGNLDRMMQMVHVDDLCRGILKATTVSVPSGSVYSIAEKQAYPMRKLVSLLEEASGKKAFPLPVPGPLFKTIAAVSEMSFRLVGAAPMLTVAKANELLGSWEASTEKARRELGFESQISFLDGARETFAWYRQHRWL